jgi:hypothetical protein
MTDAEVANQLLPVHLDAVERGVAVGTLVAPEK